MTIKSFQEFLDSHQNIKAAFTQACRSRSVSKGITILGQGDTEQDMIWLKEGEAKVVIFSEGGHEVHLAKFSPGALFGEMATLLNRPRSSNVVALTNCTLDTITAPQFKALMKQYPDLAIYMTKMLADRLHQTSQCLFENLAFTVPQRVYETLLRQAAQTSKDVETFRLKPAPSVTSLSETLNVSREATSRAISRLVSRGLLKRTKIHWDIIQPDFGDI